jgi:effector-binding domain-containing protein
MRKYVVVVWLIIAILGAGMSACAAPKDEQPVKIFRKTTEPRTVAVMRHKGSFDAIPTVMMKLIDQIQKGGHYVGGPPMGVYFNSPNQVAEADLEWEIRIPVVYPGKMGGDVGHDKMVFKYMDAMLVAYTYHVGSYESSSESVLALLDWCENTGHEIASYPIEVYWSDPQTIPQDQLVTEIWVPIEESEVPARVVR